MSILYDLVTSGIQISASGALSGLLLNGVHLSTVTFSNVSGDGVGNGMPYAYGVLNVGNPTSGAWGASGNPAVYAWILSDFTGNGYETSLQLTGTTTNPPVARPADFYWQLDANQSGQQRTDLSPVPIGSRNKVIYWNQAGELLGGSGTYAYLYFTTDGTA